MVVHINTSPIFTWQSLARVAMELISEKLQLPSRRGGEACSGCYHRTGWFIFQSVLGNSPGWDVARLIRWRGRMKFRGYKPRFWGEHWPNNYVFGWILAQRVGPKPHNHLGGVHHHRWFQLPGRPRGLHTLAPWPSSGNSTRPALRWSCRVSPRTRKLSQWTLVQNLRWFQPCWFTSH